MVVVLGLEDHYGLLMDRERIERLCLREARRLRHNSTISYSINTFT